MLAPIRRTTTRTITATGTALPMDEWGESVLLVHSVNGIETLNHPFEYRLILRTADDANLKATWDLTTIIGTRINLSIACDGKINAADFIDNAFGADITRQAGELLKARIGAHIRHIDGIVTHAEHSGTEGRNTLYTLVLHPWTNVMRLTNRYRIYQRISPVVLIEQILQTYGYPYELRLTSSYPQLDYQVQYDESDDTFIRRIAAEHGINLHYTHTDKGHSLILSDHLGAYPDQPSVAYQQLYTYPPELKLQEEYLHSVRPRQRHTVGQISLADYQFKTPSTQQTATVNNPWDTGHNGQEVYEWTQGDYIDAAQGQHKANIAMQRYRQHGYRAIAQGNVRGVQIGYRTELLNHPTEDTNRAWIVMGQTITLTEIASESRNSSVQFSTETTLLLHPDSEQIRPERIPKPKAHSQTARVVGAQNHEIYTDQYGRVKVQFHWDNDGQFDANSTCWLRVSSPWAGNEYGASHIPRVGSEVLVNFINDDPDMPIIIGRMSHPEQMPPWSLPTQYSLSGYRSKEIEGTRYNKLILDDTTGNIQAQLGSDHQTSELHLGHITRIADTQGRTDYRGQGFELRTDGHGAVRAGQGLLITTHGKAEAAGHITELNASANRLQNAIAQQKLHNQIAIDLKADERAIDDTAHVQLNEQHSEIAGDIVIASEAKQSNGASTTKFPELQAPHLVIDSAAGIVLATPKTTHTAAGEHLALTANRDLSMSVGKRLIASVGKGINLLAHSAGMNWIAGKGKLQIQAQSDNVELTAEKVFKIISAKQSITFAAAEEILLTAGGSYVKINKSGIEHGTTGNYVIHAAGHPTSGPNSMPYEMPKDPYNEMFVIKNKKGKPMANFKYIITVDDKEYRGVTNEKGEALRIGTGTQAKQITLKADISDDEHTTQEQA